MSRRTNPLKQRQKRGLLQNKKAIANCTTKPHKKKQSGTFESVRRSKRSRILCIFFLRGYFATAPTPAACAPHASFFAAMGQSHGNFPVFSRQPEKIRKLPDYHDFIVPYHSVFCQRFKKRGEGSCGGATGRWRVPVCKNGATPAQKPGFRANFRADWGGNSLGGRKVLPAAGKGRAVF